MLYLSQKRVVWLRLRQDHLQNRLGWFSRFLGYPHPDGHWVGMGSCIQPPVSTFQAFADKSNDEEVGTVVAELLLLLLVGSSFSPIPLTPYSSVKQVDVSKLWGVCKNLCKIE